MPPASVGGKAAAEKAETRRWDEDSDSDDEDGTRAGGSFADFFSDDPQKAERASVSRTGGRSVSRTGSGGGGVSGIGKRSSGKTRGGGDGGGDVKRRKKTDNSSPQHALSVGAKTDGGLGGLLVFVLLSPFISLFTRRRRRRRRRQVKGGGREGDYGSSCRIDVPFWKPTTYARHPSHGFCALFIFRGALG